MKNHSHYTINNNKHKLGNIKKKLLPIWRNCEYAFYTLTNTNINYTTNKVFSHMVCLYWLYGQIMMTTPLFLRKKKDYEQVESHDDSRIDT